MLSTYHAGLHCQSLPINPASGELQSTLKPANKPASIRSLLELSHRIATFKNIITYMHALLGKVLILTSLNERCLEALILPIWNITPSPLVPIAYPPCANIQTTLCE
jgi:hypothetical protein